MLAGYRQNHGREEADTDPYGLDRTIFLYFPVWIYLGTIDLSPSQLVQPIELLEIKYPLLIPFNKIAYYNAMVI